MGVSSEPGGDGPQVDEIDVSVWVFRASLTSDRIEKETRSEKIHQSAKSQRQYFYSQERMWKKSK